uniref:Immunoglobulin C1-set domain-containing protein n=1 Tax=Anas platyrhynchos platyrhynchos TaxID=8840 RepID=A0A493TNX8_ANAPP
EVLRRGVDFLTLGILLATLSTSSSATGPSSCRAPNLLWKGTWEGGAGRGCHRLRYRAGTCLHSSSTPRSHPSARQRQGRGSTPFGVSHAGTSPSVLPPGRPGHPPALTSCTHSLSASCRWQQEAHARGFYPPEPDDYNPISAIPNGDWSYQTQVSVLVAPVAGDTYTCSVQHVSLQEPLLEDGSEWRGAEPQPEAGGRGSLLPLTRPWSSLPRYFLHIHGHASCCETAETFKGHVNSALAASPQPLT